MSTKSSIFLTEDDEHCYFEHFDGTIVLEMDKKNIEILENDEFNLIIEIKPDCELFKLIGSITQDF